MNLILKIFTEPKKNALHHPHLVNWRWPSGFKCFHCGSDKYCLVGARKLFQCDRCHAQISVTAQTIFDSTKLPLQIWFRAMYHLTQSKGGISSLELFRRLGVTVAHSLEDVAETHASHA